MNAPEITGLVFAGYILHPQINGDRPTPHYEFAERADGKPSINTLEGWNASAEEQTRKNRERGYPY